MQHFARLLYENDRAGCSQLHGRVRAVVMRETGAVPWA
jgi:hypothetical protein